MTANALALLQAFLNSHDNDGRDEWFDPEAPAEFDRWAHGPAAGYGAYYAGRAAAAEAGRQVSAIVGDAPATAADVAVARDVRDALLSLLLDGAAPDGLSDILARLPVRLEVAGDRLATRPQGRGPLALAAAAVLAAQELQVRGDWERLRLCRADDCHWAFLDQSKNRSRVWCDMTTCGAKAKARAYRERRRGA